MIIIRIKIKRIIRIIIRIINAILINATSSHGRSQRFHFFAALPSEKTLLTQVLVFSYSHIAGHHFAILINATSSHGRTGRMKVMPVEHHKMQHPFPLESFSAHLIFLRAVGFHPARL